MADVVEIIVQDGIPGPKGETGIDGLSAYEIWLAEGNTGTEQDFLNSLIGPQGPQGEQGEQGIQGEKGDKGGPGNDGEQGTPGAPGADGASAYEVAVDNGFIGTEEQWLESLKGDPGEKGDKGDKGDPGDDGADGTDGESAYQIWLDNGNTGSEQDFLDSLVGPAGTTDYNDLQNKPEFLSQANAQNPASTVTGLASGAVLAQAIEGRIVPVAASKTLALADRLTYQRVTAAATITIPANATVAFPVGTRIDFFQSDSGIITFSAAGGVTVNSYGDTLVTDGKGAAASLKKVGTNEWDLTI